MFVIIRSYKSFKETPDYSEVQCKSLTANEMSERELMEERKNMLN